MKVRALALALVSACSFAPHAASDGGPNPHDAPSTADAPGIDAGSGACNGKVWFADFSSDPTQLDLNGDGVKDFAIRDGSMFPTEQLTGSGTWATPLPSKPLDTQPKQSYATRTLVHARMRATALGSGATGGAVFWINVGFDGSGSFAPAFVDIDHDSLDGQTLTLWTKDASGTLVSLASVGGLSTDFVDFDLDIDPSTLAATLSVGGTTSTQTLVRQTATGSDEWGTVIAFGTASEFDSMRVEVCP